MDDALTLEKDEKVQTRAEDDEEKHIGQIAASENKELSDGDKVDSNPSRPFCVTPRLNAGPNNCKSAENSHRDLKNK